MYDDDDDEAATTASKEKKPPSTASPERQPHRPRKSATERMLEQQGVQLTLGWQFLPPPLAPITPEVRKISMFFGLGIAGHTATGRAPWELVAADG
mmetsp:Transcript_45351/g.142204  ORF Transcript_45351/g.142204 Transcript_45351/m.142204 type:complete len:96 (-) Transcript_45351:143-430(-)